MAVYEERISALEQGLESSDLAKKFADQQRLDKLIADIDALNKVSTNQTAP